MGWNRPLCFQVDPLNFRLVWHLQLEVLGLGSAPRAWERPLPSAMGCLSAPACTKLPLLPAREKSSLEGTGPKARHHPSPEHRDEAPSQEPTSPGVAGELWPLQEHSSMEREHSELSTPMQPWACPKAHPSRLVCCCGLEQTAVLSLSSWLNKKEHLVLFCSSAGGALK